MITISFFQWVRFFLLALLWSIITYSSMQQFSWPIGLYQGVLLWAFCAMCTPLIRGRVVIGIPCSLIWRKKKIIPEIVALIVALAMSFLSFAFYSEIFFYTRISYLFFSILSQPETFWPLWLINAASSIYNGYLSSFVPHRSAFFKESLGSMLYLAAWIITAMVLYQPFIVSLNAHGGF